MMSYGLLTPGYGQSYEHAALYRRLASKGEFWSYPQDHIFFRSRMSATPYHPKAPTIQRSLDANRHICCLSQLSNEIGLNNGHVGGALERISQMPVDILYEILFHLHPTDVLSLSRTTQDLHRILLGRQARGVWRNALANVRALPPCPPDLTEVQYASLTFDNFCTCCLATEGTQRILWVCRVRFCQKCIEQQFVSEDELDLWIPEDIYIEKPDVIFPCIPSSKPLVGRKKLLYFLPTTTKYLQELDDLEASKDSNALAAWIQEKKDIQTMRVAHAALCEYWNTYLAYRGPLQSSPPWIWEIMIVIFLILLLAVLGRHKLELVLQYSF